MLRFLFFFLQDALVVQGIPWPVPDDKELDHYRSREDKSSAPPAAKGKSIGTPGNFVPGTGPVFGRPWSMGLSLHVSFTYRI